MMKLILSFLLSFTVLAGAGTFPQGDHVKNLKDKIEFKNSKTQIISNDSDDPSAVAKFGEAGSLYLRTNGELWQKLDSGSSTNWAQLFITPLFTSANKLIKSDGLTDILDTGIDVIGTDALGNIDYLGMDIAVGAPAHTEGLLFYDPTSMSLSYYNDDSDVTINIGQEQVIRARNTTGITINDGDAVVVTGSTGQTPNVGLASSAVDADTTSIGLWTSGSTATNGFGYITTFGNVGGLNTSSFAEGDRIYLDTIAGGLVNAPPVAPASVILIGMVTNSHASQGKIFVRPAESDASHMNWRGDWVAGQYAHYDTVRDNGWTMIANKTTEERAAPIPTGDPLNVFSGTIGSDSVTAKQVIYGQRYSNAQGVFINSYRVNTLVGNNYRIFSVKDPLGTPVITELISFEAQAAGWQVFNIDPLLLAAGSTFDLVVISSEPDPTPTEFSGAWSYQKPTNVTAPLTGQIVQSSKEAHLINVHKTDNAAGDRSTALEGLTNGDIIELDSVRWSIQAVTDNTTYMTYSVAPASQSTLTGVQTFNFETVTATPLTYGYLQDQWLANVNVRGLFVADDSYDNIAITNHQYGIDLNVTEADISEDWDVIATGSISSSANTIVPFTVTNSVGLEGNGAYEITATTESIPFDGNGTGWTSGANGSTPTSGNYYEVQFPNSVVTIDGVVFGGAIASNSIYLYKNGAFYKNIYYAGNSVTASSHHIKYKGYINEFNVNDKLAFVTDVTISPLIDSPVHYLNINETAQSSGTVFATDSNKEDIVVEGSGALAPLGITSNVTPIKFTETKDTHNAWNGSQFTTPENGPYTWAGSIRTDASNPKDIGLYVDGVLRKRYSNEFPTIIQKFSITVYLLKDEVAELRLATTDTISNSQNYHHLSITKQAVNVDNVIVDIDALNIDHNPNDVEYELKGQTLEGKQIYRRMVRASGPYNTATVFMTGFPVGIDVVDIRMISETSTGGGSLTDYADGTAFAYGDYQRTSNQVRAVISGITIINIKIWIDYTKP